MARPRILYAALAPSVIALGLASRRYAFVLPLFLRKSAGDSLWALMVFLLCGMLFPRRTTLWIATVAMTFSACIEFSQIYHAPWIDAIRAYPLGHLILGSGFAWGDMLSYAEGIGVGILVEAGLRREPGKRSTVEGTANAERVRHERSAL